TVRSRKRFELASELLQILLSFSCDAISKAVVKNQRERDCGEDRCRKEMPEVHQGGHDKREKKEEDKCSTDECVRSAFGCHPASQQSSLLERLPILSAGVLKFLGERQVASLLGCSGCPEECEQMLIGRCQLTQVLGLGR